MEDRSRIFKELRRGKKEKERETIVLEVTNEDLGVNFVHGQRKVGLHVALRVKNIEKANGVANDDVEGFVSVNVKDGW